jgi:hypothetical protein
MQRLHDWPLDRLSLDWKNGDLVLTLDTASLVCRGVTAITIPRSHPWGPSVYINELRGPTDTPDRLKSIELEMQSGDVIKVTAQAFEIPPEE